MNCAQKERIYAKGFKLMKKNQNGTPLPWHQ